MPLVERADDLARLEAALADARGGKGSVILLVGEPGIGKTSLIEEHLRDRTDVRVLWGSCDDLATPRTLGPIRDIARSVGGNLADALGSGDQGRVREAFLDELEKSRLPTVAVIEDVHWADEATVHAVSFAGRRIERTRAVMVITARDEALHSDHPVRIAFGSLPPHLVRRIEPRPLTKQGVAELSPDRSADASELLALSGGNPFFLTELLASRDRALPASIRDAVLARARHLSPSSRDLLNLVSVVPGRMERSLLTSLRPQASGLLAEAAKAGLIVYDQTAAWFRHELARRSIEAELTQEERETLNQQVVNALEQAGSDPARIVHHSVAAGDRARLIRWAPVAARAAAAASAHREAAAHFERAIELIDAYTTAEQADIFEEYTLEATTVGKKSEALSATARAVALRRELGDPKSLGRALRQDSRTLWVFGNRAGSERSGDEAIEVLAPLPADRELAMAYSNRSQLAMLANYTTDAIAWGNEAIALARKLGATEILSHALNNVGSARCFNGDTEEGLAQLRESLAIAKQ
ncbi:MAG TPA: AAA family ATPase, partial [Acidimicrobiia bacterium]